MNGQHHFTLSTSVSHPLGRLLGCIIHGYLGHLVICRHMATFMTVLVLYVVDFSVLYLFYLVITRGVCITMEYLVTRSLLSFIFLVNYYA